jgi:putative tryptophan/tyrosine transport system substrate-binding protein
MKRRQFIAGLGSAAAWPVVARAQQPATPMIGWLDANSANSHVSFLAAFHTGLKETGFVEGQNVAVEYRWADGRYDRLSAWRGKGKDRSANR